VREPRRLPSPIAHAAGSTLVRSPASIDLATRAASVERPRPSIGYKAASVDRLQCRHMSALAASESPSRNSPLARGPRLGAADYTWRVLNLLNVFRLVVGAVLLSTLLFVRDPLVIGATDASLALVCLVALISGGAIGLALVRRRWPGAVAQTYAHFTIDLVAIVGLIHSSGGIASGFGGLLVVSAGALALLVPPDRAFLLAALATLAMLVEQTFSQLRGLTTSADYAQAGILGAVIFVIAAVVQFLRYRLVETEALAEQRGVDLQNLVELNEYIIQHLRESIVVVDGSDGIRLINESASKLLGIKASAQGLGVDGVSRELAQHLALWREDGDDFGRSTIVLGGTDGGPNIQPHFAGLGAGRDDGVVIFLEDTSLIAERVQQTKLAALGRLSASIAHEIRNPLGALSHAGQLLAESESMGPEEHRLTDIIRVNSRRVSQIVDSVLALSKRDRTHPEKFELRAWARDFAKEFTDTQELYEGAITVGAGAQLEVEMDRTHLHQVLWNLCDNAVKYASEVAGAIAVELDCGVLEPSGRPYLDVTDRGPGISPDKVEEVFEPFYTGQVGGTGLGLYISRELCERNGATLRYHPRAGGGSVFRIVFADPSRWQSR
jgi:two-component system sensor histidine kinase PilS (NtrC family)